MDYKSKEDLGNFLSAVVNGLLATNGEFSGFVRVWGDRAGRITPLDFDFFPLFGHLYLSESNDFPISTRNRNAEGGGRTSEDGLSLLDRELPRVVLRPGFLFLFPGDLDQWYS